MIINMNGAKAPETPSPVLQEKTVTPETLPTVIGADEGYDGLSQVTINPDSQLKAENIRSGKTIFGVDGTFEGTVTQGDKFAKLVDGTITDITVEDLGSITLIDDYKFKDCKSLTTVSMPDTVINIYGSAFYSCQQLSEVNFSANLAYIGPYAFYECPIRTISLPNTVTYLGSDCFRSNSSLTSLTLPEGLKTIPYNCFYFCYNLTSVTIPASIVQIDSSAFEICRALTSVIMKPTTPPTLGSNVFADTNANLVITVPKGSLTAYQTASNWSAYADKMVEANE